MELKAYKIICIICTALLFLFSIILMCLLGLYLRGLGMRANCVPGKELVIFAHRAYTKEYQEDTLEAAVAATEKGLGFEFDLQVTKDNKMIVFHDWNAKNTTGVDRDIRDMTWPEVQKLKYKQTLYGKTYSSQPGIPLLEDVLKAVCTINPNVNINFDIKFDYTPSSADLLYKITDASPCSCDPNKQTFIYDLPFPWAINSFKYDIQSRRCKGMFTLYFHPGTIPLGIFFWLKSRIFVAFGGADIISTHFTVWDQHEPLLREYEKAGFCTSIYGDYADKLAKYKPSISMCADVSDASLSYATYSPETYYLNIFDFLMVMGFTSFIASIFLIISFAKKWIFGDDELAKNYKQIDEDMKIKTIEIK